jgi:hypothetical protein
MGNGRILGDVTSGFHTGNSIARDRSGQILGRSSSKFNNTRDAQGHIVSQNRADVGPDACTG